MEKLVKESDGFFRTASAHCAVVPKIASGSFEEQSGQRTNWFEFKASALGQVVRVEWPAGSPLAIFDADTAGVMLRAGYARNITDEIATTYNEAVDQQHEIDAKAAEEAAKQKSATGKQQGSSAPDGTDDKGKGTEPQQGNPSETPAPVNEAGNPAPADPAFPPEGWAAHPTAPGFYYKDQEVLSEADLRAKVGA